MVASNLEISEMMFSSDLALGFCFDSSSLWACKLSRARIRPTGVSFVSGDSNTIWNPKPTLDVVVIPLLAVVVGALSTSDETALVDDRPLQRHS